MVAKTHLEKARTAICRSLSAGGSSGYWISSGPAGSDPPFGEIIAVLRDRALFVNKDADSNGKDLTVNQKCLDITHLEKGTYSNCANDCR